MIVECPCDEVLQFEAEFTVTEGPTGDFWRLKLFLKLCEKNVLYSQHEI